MILPWDLMIIGNFISAARLRLSEHKGSSLTLLPTLAERCKLYICSKFARTLLNVLKTTQDLTPQKWAYVPLQDFTSSSDIDWSKSIAEIDEQLFDKYGLDEPERNFIRTKVKEMNQDARAE